MASETRPILREDVDAGLVVFSVVVEPGATVEGPIHVGEHLADFIEDYGWSARELARRLAVPHNRVLAILAGDRSVTADTALQLATLFRTSPAFWLNLQMRYDLQRSRAAHGAAIVGEVQPVQAAPSP